MITHYDLFAGIGGFSLALEEVFQDDSIRHIFCEWESFPTAVLRQHWPDGEFYGDIADLVTDTKSQRSSGSRETRGTTVERSTRRRGLTNNFTIVTGGFPCQPFSAAGRRKGTADDRYQWPNMFEVIRNTSPDWVIAENVRGLVTWNEGLVLETVCADLESEGYEVQPFIIPAVAVGAPHRRDRVWIIANNQGKRDRGENQELGQKKVEAVSENEGRAARNTSSEDGREYPDWSRNWQEVAFATCDDAIYDGLPTWLDGVIRGNGGLNGTESETVTRQDVRDLYAAFQSEDFRAAFGRCYKVRNTEVLLEVLRQLSEDTETTKRNFQLDGPSFTEDYVRQMQQQAATRRPSSEWERNRQSAAKHTDDMPQLSRPSTLEIAKAWYCVRLVQQSIIMEPVDNGEIKLSAAAHRKDSLKAYGNGIVHQVATQIIKAIKEQNEV